MKTVHCFAVLLLPLFPGLTLSHAQPTAPFGIVEVVHPVNDYTVWKKAFDQDDPARKASGPNAMVVGRNTDKPAGVSVTMLAAVTGSAGITARPDVGFYHVLRTFPSKKRQWVRVVVKGADFDAWLKAFDGERSGKRANSDGKPDVALARGSDGPHPVYLIFDVGDEAKASAALASEERKKTDGERSGAGAGPNQLLHRGPVSRPVPRLFRQPTLKNPEAASGQSKRC